MIFMTHPKHGAMNVTSQAESLANQKNGWVESTHEAWLGNKAKPAHNKLKQMFGDSAAPVEAAPIGPTEAPKKRGRPAKAE